VPDITRINHRSQASRLRLAADGFQFDVTMTEYRRIKIHTASLLFDLHPYPIGALRRARGYSSQEASMPVSAVSWFAVNSK